MYEEYSLALWGIFVILVTVLVQAGNDPGPLVAQPGLGRAGTDVVAPLYTRRLKGGDHAFQVCRITAGKCAGFVFECEIEPHLDNTWLDTGKSI